MMTTFQTITDRQAYEALRLEAIALFEGYELLPYIDTADDPHPTIDIGFNLDDREVRETVINALGVDPDSTALLAQEQRDAEQFYFDIIESAAATATTPSSTPTGRV